MESPTSSNGSGRSAPRLSLQQLVAHFVASKRSLSAAAHVQRAQELVQAARGSLETSAVLGARNVFVRRVLTEQARALDAVRLGVEQVGVEVHDEFAELLRTLDETDAQLQAAVTILRDTLVEPSLQTALSTSLPPASPTRSSHVSDAPRHLYDFVDDAAPAALHATLRACIDRYNAARSLLADHADSLAVRLSEFNEVVSGAEVSSRSRNANRSAGSPASPPEWERQHPSHDVSLPSIFRALETHATEAADLLQSLVRHYDLCVTALKHTEGGGEAAAAELGLDIGEEGADAVLQRSDEDQDGQAPPPPLTDDEREDMMIVLDKDASEVEDVVNEIRDRLVGMEPLLSDIQLATDTQRVERSSLSYAARLLQASAPSDEDRRSSTGAKSAVDAAATFSKDWEAERERIMEARGQLEALAEFYDGFAAAYDGLIVEVARRGEAQRKVDKAVRDAVGKVERMVNEEVQARDTFRADQGDFLPSDIWPGLADPPVRYELCAVDGPAMLPNVPRVALERALRRIRERG